MKIERTWAMPNKHTFLIPPIKKLIFEEIRGESFWADPFAGENSPAIIKNDINPNIDNVSHHDALEFLQNWNKIEFDGVLFDPPYSVRQVVECYGRYGYGVTQETTQATWYSKIKDEIARVVKPGGKCISFGWNSNGIGKTRGFEISRILLVAHGGAHNDTIVTVERKVNGVLF